MIECGETWTRLAEEARADLREPVDNVPRQPESFEALKRLCADVLDPVFDEFGVGQLTYGFSSHALSREIPRGIAPRLDQHASCEFGPRGNRICSRLGAAVDFESREHSALDIAEWIGGNTRFDRLYYYGPDRPIHVSAGPDDSRSVVLVQWIDGRQIPRVVERTRLRESATPPPHAKRPEG